MINTGCAKFLTSVFDVTKMNVPKKPEIVFVGRSNVGKSSMINALLNRKNIARTGSTPGKTVSVNIYDIGTVYFVDLPGYGYAQRSKVQREGWGSLIGEYLGCGRDVRLVIMLVDIRHTPSEDDMLMYRWLMEKEMLFSVVATKCDKLSKTELAEAVKKLSRIFRVKVIPFSAQTRTGAEEIMQIAEDLTSEGQ